jgi:DNA-binding response OmpR family regulator
MPRILIVDDEPGIRQSLKGVFEDEGFADAVSNGEDCLKKIDHDRTTSLRHMAEGNGRSRNVVRLREKTPHTTSS